MVERMHHTEDEVVAAEAADPATLLVENQSLRDQLLRALADADNARKRAERAAEESRRYAISNFARELLPVADNLQRALAAAETRAISTPDRVLLEGVQATERLFLQTLERFGIRRIEALGARFDPEQHDAMLEVESPDSEPGVVVQVLEDGYTIHERLLRPARVAVSRNRAAAEPKTDQSHSTSS